MSLFLNVDKYFLWNPAPAAGACPPAFAPAKPLIAFSSRLLTAIFLSCLLALTDIGFPVLLIIMTVLCGCLSPRIVLSGEWTL